MGATVKVRAEPGPPDKQVICLFAKCLADRRQWTCPHATYVKTLNLIDDDTLADGTPGT